MSSIHHIDHQYPTVGSALVLPPRSAVRHHGTVTNGDPAANLIPADEVVGVEVSAADFDTFYAKHRNEVGSALAFTLGSKSLAEEAVDEAMARAYQRWKTVSQYENAAGWVYRTGLNWGRSWQRSMFRRKRREERVSRDLPTTTELTSIRPELMEALQELPVDQRAVVVLRYYCDWSVEDTAEALDITPGTVKSRSSRGLERLRGTLGSNGGLS